MITKPIHLSQKIINEDEVGTVFCIDVVHNFELERELLGFGEELEVIAPKLLKRNIKRRLEQATK
ncbi:WYL domain-containing protein [Faecalibacter macacae]|uniref:WYL domain-containing protein n=1 Tax=Faecalibacter macacae TaxID=1859289 RepID=UPI0021D36644|nr:WYL domain-containing protein [Faecalibacter macacae]